MIIIRHGSNRRHQEHSRLLVRESVNAGPGPSWPSSSHLLRNHRNHTVKHSPTHSLRLSPKVKRHEPYNSYASPHDSCHLCVTEISETFPPVGKSLIAHTDVSQGERRYVSGLPTPALSCLHAMWGNLEVLSLEDGPRQAQPQGLTPPTKTSSNSHRQVIRYETVKAAV